nr:limb region 1 protein homolog isoform X3 [Vicugna pacos]
MMIAVHGTSCHRGGPGEPMVQFQPEFEALGGGSRQVRFSDCLWNLASLFSNLCLFVLMPFAFFFLESEGFAGLKKGIRARILETLVMLILLALLILGMVWVASALVDNDAASMESLYDLWEFYLPYLYSCISLMGCLLLLLCTPVGLSRMFTVMGQLLVKPAILEDLDEQIYMITLEEEALQRRLNGLSSSVEYNMMEMEQELENVKTLKTKLERRKKASAWERNLVYPAVMVLLLIETGPGIGSASLSAFGFVGAALEIILIFYLMVSSVVGFYSLRCFGTFIPKKDDTTMTKIIGNCVSILVLSSALPVMSRTLGEPFLCWVLRRPLSQRLQKQEGAGWDPQEDSGGPWGAPALVFSPFTKRYHQSRIHAPGPWPRPRAAGAGPGSHGCQPPAPGSPSIPAAHRPGPPASGFSPSPRP